MNSILRLAHDSGKETIMDLYGIAQEGKMCYHLHYCISCGKMLGFNLDESYITFIKEYGHGGIGGIEIMGIGKNNVLISADETMSYRDYGLSDNLFVVENCDEWIYCIDSTNGKIISWSNGDIMPAYDNFDAYLLDRFSDAAENLE